MDMIERAVAIFIPSSLLWMCKRGLDCRETLVMWYGGTIRGAIAFAMVLYIESSDTEILKTTVMVVVLITTIVLGALLPVFTDFIGLDEVRVDKSI